MDNKDYQLTPKCVRERRKKTVRMSALNYIKLNQLKLNAFIHYTIHVGLSNNDTYKIFLMSFSMIERLLMDVWHTHTHTHKFCVGKA